MQTRITLEELEKDLQFFNKMYDAARIVNPVEKSVLDYRCNSPFPTDEICYDYWKNGKICENCISIRAFNDNMSYMKLEQSPEVIMLVTALPVETSERPVVLELLKNATDSMMIGSGDYSKGQNMRNIVYHLNDMVVKDSLTSIYNRRFIDDRLPADIVRATISASPLSVLFIDVDNMKTINDTYGHTAGDMAIKHTADVISRCIRASDWVARYGGDEFLVCLNGTKSEAALSTAKRISSQISATALSFKDCDITISVSFGIKTMENEQITAQEIINMADERMYENKKKKYGI